MKNQIRAVESDWTADNPPFGAIFTYHVRSAMASGTSLAIDIRDADGDDVARVTLDGSAGLRRVAWNLRSAPTSFQQVSGDPAGGRGDVLVGGRGGGRGGRGGGGGGGGEAVPVGRYSAQLVKLAGGSATPIGAAQVFYVRELPQ
jgi:hypothetical protein